MVGMLGKIVGAIRWVIAGTIGIIFGVMVRKSGQTVAGLMYGQAGTLITQASITTITYAVYRIANDREETLTGSGTLTVSAVVFDTAQTTDPRYVLAGGYNFLAVIPATCFQTGGLTHRIEVLFTPVSGQPFTQIWEGVAL